jgi:hypothetical protein
LFSAHDFLSIFFLLFFERALQAPVINFPVFNTNSSQQSLARFRVENNLITLVQI